MVEAEHRQHAVVELTIRDLNERNYIGMKRLLAQALNLLAQALNQLRRPESPPNPYPQLSELASRYRDGTGVERGLTQYEYRVFSQNGEDGVICELLRRLQVETAFFVEFGIGDGLQCNCLFLAEVLGWHGLWLEASEAARSAAERWRDRKGIAVAQRFVTPDNVNKLFQEHVVPDEPALVSIDIDGNDYYVWEALESRPLLLVIEYNSSLPTDPATRLVQVYSEGGGPWGQTDYFGASLGALEALGRRKGYRLVYTDLTGVNAFFARQDLPGVLDMAEVAPRRATNYYFSGRGWPPDSHARRFRRV